MKLSWFFEKIIDKPSARFKKKREKSQIINGRFVTADTTNIRLLMKNSIPRDFRI